MGDKLINRFSSIGITYQKAKNIEGEMKRKQINSSIRVAEMPSLDRRHLQIELIADILSRLTLKDVMRYRCVSKSWFALINDSYFKEKHAERIESSANLILLTREAPGVEGLYMADLNDTLLEDKEVMLNFCQIGVKGMYFYKVVGDNLVGSCDGLVCSLYTASSYTAIWNPSTTEYNMMPPIRPVAYDDLDWKRYCVISYGFGHDRISGDYKVLAITKMNGEDDFAGVGIEVWVYSLKKKSWAKQSWNFPNLIIRSTEVGTFASTRNALHWIMERNIVDLNNRQKVIVAFDIGVPIKKTKDTGVDNGYHEVQQPDYKIKPYCLALGALRGCLCNHSIYHNFSSDLWVMNKESWTRLISFADPLPNWPLPGCVKPIAYSRGGDKVLLYDCAHNKLIWYDLKTKTVTIVKLWSNLPVAGVCLHQNIKYDKRRENIKNDKRREGRSNLFSSVFKIFRCGT